MWSYFVWKWKFPTRRWKSWIHVEYCVSEEQAVERAQELTKSTGVRHFAGKEWVEMVM